MKLFKQRLPSIEDIADEVVSQDAGWNKRDIIKKAVGYGYSERDAKKAVEKLYPPGTTPRE